MHGRQRKDRGVVRSRGRTKLVELWESFARKMMRVIPDLTSEGCESEQHSSRHPDAEDLRSRRAFEGLELRAGHERLTEHGNAPRMWKRGVLGSVTRTTEHVVKLARASECARVVEDDVSRCELLQAPSAALLAA